MNMFNPFFDTSSMTYEELNNKLVETSNRLNTAIIQGMNYEVIQTMQNVINACQEEMYTRMCIAESKGYTDPCLFDMESYLPDSEENTKRDRKRKQRDRPEW